MSKKTDASQFRSGCPLATALDLVGDKWSLVILRDLLWGRRKYKDFQGSPERIPTNILANRLRKLELEGIIGKRSYQEKPPRFEYFLTAKGADLLPVMQALAIWGQKHIPERWTPPEWFFSAQPSDLLRKLDAGEDSSSGNTPP